MAESDGRDRTFADAVTLGGFRLGALAARALPGLAAAALATPIGFGASTTNRDRRAMVERHLRRANPALDGLALRRAVQESFDSYARYWIESFRLPSLHKQVVDGGIKVSGYEHVAAGLDAGSGVILALPHLGGWEWAGRWLALRGVKITVVVERLDPPELFDWFVKLRSELGMTVVALGPDAGKAVLGALKRNEVVCLLSDRDLDGRGIEVEFFGERTTLPAGPATLGIRTGAPILPTAVYFTPRYNGHFGLVRPPLDTTRSGSLRDDVARITQQLARDLELLITRAPQQWHMFQPNWPSDPGYQKSPSRRRQRVTQVGSRRAARAWTLCAVRSPVPSTVMAGLGAVRWGRARDGRRHLVQTRARFLGRPGVTPVSMCGVDIETLTRPGTAWDESSPLACAQCTRARAESISDASSAPPE